MPLSNARTLASERCAGSTPRVTAPPVGRRLAVLHQEARGGLGDRGRAAWGALRLRPALRCLPRRDRGPPPKNNNNNNNTLTHNPAPSCWAVLQRVNKHTSASRTCIANQSTAPADDSVPCCQEWTINLHIIRTGGAAGHPNVTDVQSCIECHCPDSTPSKPHGAIECCKDHSYCWSAPGCNLDGEKPGCRTLREKLPVVSPKKYFLQVPKSRRRRRSHSHSAAR